MWFHQLTQIETLRLLGMKIAKIKVGWNAKYRTKSAYLWNKLMKIRRHQRTHRNCLRNLIIWIGLIITPLLVLVLWCEVENLIENFKSKKKLAEQVINLTATQEPLYVEDANRSMYDNMHHLIKEQMDGVFWRRVYPFSVVDGGVHSVQELRSAIWRDPVIAKHYSNFKLDRARIIEAQADGDFHVSYRIGEEIFWTKKRLKVAKGERLITDGMNFARTRCANVLSELPRAKTSPDEPTSEVLDTPTVDPPEPTPFILPVGIVGGPPDPNEQTSDVLEAPTLPPSEPTPFTPPVVIAGGSPDSGGGSGDGNGDGNNDGNSPVPAPEQTTMLLLGTGLIGLVVYWRKKFFMKRNPPKHIRLH
jgi:hypothetical protein